MISKGTDAVADSISTGIDIVEIKRFKRLSADSAFLERVFTAGELSYSRKKKFPYKHLAGRFAAKEAFLKALSTGLSRGIGFKDIEVIGAGKPAPILAGRAGELLGNRRIFLSLSYSGEYAAAFAAIGPRD